jgi:predicted SAM-dependent methyltransferase
MRAGDTLLAKWKYYSKRYGRFHAAMSHIGRSWPSLWRIIGRRVTSSYLQEWLKTAEPKIVNLGGGSNCLDGCLTVDVDPRADAYVDMAIPLPFPDSSVDAVFAEEVLEHIDEESGLNLLRECFRMLKHGGVIRLSTPDLDHLFNRAIHGGIDGTRELNEVFFCHGHKYLYTRETLLAACSQAGFASVRLSSYGDPASVLGHLDSHADRFNHSPDVSMYVEAEKPA